MISRCPNQMGLRVAALVGLLVVAAGPSPAQQPAARNPHDGEWSLEFRVYTRPGGEVFAVGDDTQRINFLFQVAKESFAVAADGVLKWEQREGGQFYADDFSARLGRTSIQNLQPVLRLSGQAVATPAARESGRTYDRKLSLQLAWTGGSGPAIPHAGKPFVIALSADGNQWTMLGYTRGAPYEKTTWELTPTSVRQEEIAVDTIRETTMFRASRQKTLVGFGAPGFPIPVTEYIEVKHVRYPHLVPRG